MRRRNLKEFRYAALKNLDMQVWGRCNSTENLYGAS